MLLQVVRSKAEALAKAQYACKKDAHDCALMYAALQKKQLLLVSSTHTAQAKQYTTATGSCSSVASHAEHVTLHL